MSGIFRISIMKISSHAPLDIDQVYETCGRSVGQITDPDAWLESDDALVGTPRLPPALGRDRHLDRPDRLRRVLCGPGVEALVPVVLDPRLLGVRGQSADAEDIRLG